MNLPASAGPAGAEPRSLRARIIDWAPAAAIALAIFAASSFSRLPVPPGASDKALHAIAFGALGACILSALSGRQMARVRARDAMLAVLLATLYGVSDEFHQRFVPGRTPDVADIVADARGAAIAAGAAWTCSIIASSYRRRDDA